MPDFVQVGRMLSAGLLVAVCAACSSGPQLQPETALLPERVELVDVPFFYLNDAYGGSSALAAVLNHHAVIATPGIVETRMRKLAKGKSQQDALAVVARSYDQLVYPVATDLDSLIQQVAGGQPVLVHIEKSFAGPGGEFALLVGYDQRERTVVLRQGHARRWRVSLSDFDEAWSEAGRWAVIVLPASMLPPQPDRVTWLNALRALQEQGRDLAVQRGLLAARARWPDATL
jgi:hypothetical protein